MESRTNCFEKLPSELMLGIIDFVNFKTLTSLLFVDQRFAVLSIMAFEDKQAGMLKQFQLYKKSTMVNDLALGDVDDVIFWLQFIPYYAGSEHFKLLKPANQQTELLLLALLLCEMMLYLTEHKIIQFNSIKGYVQKLVERHYVPNLNDETESVPVLGQINRNDLAKIKDQIIKHTSEARLDELLEHIKYMQVDCSPNMTMTRFKGLFSSNSEERARLWKMVDKCVGVIDRLSRAEVSFESSCSSKSLS